MGSATDGTSKPVESYGTAFQTRLEEIVARLYIAGYKAGKKSGLTMVIASDVLEPAATQAITEALRETIHACKQKHPHEHGCTGINKCNCGAWYKDDGQDEFETALLEAIDKKA